MKTLYVIKIGGNVIDNSANLHAFLEVFSALEGSKILVHGGGKMATQLSKTLGIEPKMVDGRRITDIETLRVVTMVYAGLINKNIVAQLQLHHCNAIGLTGADGNLVRAQKRPVKEIDYGYVGDLHETSVASKKLGALLEEQLVPVFSAITHDGNGQLLNTNADTVASAIAVAMSADYETSLVYCFEKKGVLADVNDDASLLAEIRSGDFEALKSEGIVADGMIPKLHNAFEAIKNGVKDVYIGKAGDLAELATQSFGTRLLS
ncbi:acetylglutamate kinase [Hufsiella ginkgonis]|uniref:Acetylglutamate kinase n=1 Tax=Hufsiella ginkgonis TaxID=2695274 RepID=A0A7K1XTX3_9SPHI|nr:acetylglutamate kinase [Hufsiella ginkgonis]MXV14400.1 acetylglutamate kinase [Hufsiella ginkgonis]